MAEPFADDRDAEHPVRGFIHRATRQPADLLVLTHGAGGNCRSPLLVGLAESFAAAGVTVLRFDLPFRQARASGPPSPSTAARDQAGIRAAIAAMRTLHPSRVFAGGQSYGGRQTTMAAATGEALVDGLLLLSYPLHPPGRATQLRTEHFPGLRTPALFVSGTKDAFGSPDELARAIAFIPSRTNLVSIPDAGHGLLTKANKTSLPATIVEAFLTFFTSR